MVESEFGIEMTDKLVMNSNIESKGVYTAIGTYDHSEIFKLVDTLSGTTGIDTGELFKIYGEYLFDRFSVNYPGLFEGIDDPLTMLEVVDSYIHKEVLKLYPDAQLPSFESNRLSKHKIELIYTSERKMSDFAHGLILGCFKHFRSTAQIDVYKKSESEVIFNIEKLDEQEDI